MRTDQATKQYMTEAFHALGRQVTRGITNTTIVKVVQAHCVGASPDQVTGWFRDAGLPYAVCQGWGLGAVMFMPAKKTNHRAAIQFVSSLPHAIKILQSYDEGMLDRPAKQMYKTVISKVDTGKPLAVAGKLPKGASLERLLVAAGAEHMEADDGIICNETEDDTSEDDIDGSESSI
ncbi:hypothetical protein LY76DRAFT_106545 [Colletotrichum caudatum]|nr:hypothetical protein LY76DRAFT_106545 [Colletotrichum caudatum]